MHSLVPFLVTDSIFNIDETKTEIPSSVPFLVTDSIFNIDEAKASRYRLLPAKQTEPVRPAQSEILRDLSHLYAFGLDSQTLR